MSSLPRQNENQDSADPGKKLIIGAVAAAVVATLGFLILCGLLVIYADTLGIKVEILRDLFIILLALSMILIMTAITVLIIQIARFVNLMTNEVQPIIHTASDTVNTVRGTAEFLSRHVTEPVVNVAGVIGGVSKVVGDVDALRKAAGIVMQATAAGSPTGARAQSNPAAEPAPPPTAPAETKPETESTDGKTAPTPDNF
jgi:hypothetical protein